MEKTIERAKRIMEVTREILADCNTLSTQELKLMAEVGERLAKNCRSMVRAKEMRPQYVQH